MSKFSIPQQTLYVCTGSKCAKRGAKDLYKAAKSFNKHLYGDGKFEIIRTECTDRCDYAPVCALQPDNIWLKEYRLKNVLAMMEELANKKD